MGKTKIPLKVMEIINSKDENLDDYLELARISKELKAIGWFMDYYLNGEITDLYPLGLKK